jgi:flagellar protein FlbD
MSTAPHPANPQASTAVVDETGEEAHGRAFGDIQGRTSVILLTRLNGPVFALNPDLVERADCTPDTVITLVDGTKYVVAESLPELVALIRQYRASVVAEAQQMTTQPPSPGGSSSDTGADNVVQLHRRER